MRLTRAGEYAVRCMLYLANNEEGRVVNRQEIAEQADIPVHFLAKIAQQLARAGLVEVRQGAHGGFVLARPPAEISLLEVVETIIGEIHLNDCIMRPESCGSQPVCAVHQVWLAARDQLRATLAAVSLEELRHGRPGAAGPAVERPVLQDGEEAPAEALAHFAHIDSREGGS